MKTSLLLISLFGLSCVFTDISAQNLPQPRYLQFDSVRLIATWQPPISKVLDEKFEGHGFPPTHWKNTTKGLGWFQSNNASSPALTILPHASRYAAVNNDLAGINNDGCCDSLITPELDLTQFESYVLTFSSFYRGLDAETASVIISTDGGNSWTTLLELLPHFAWASIQIDLSAYSGATGSNHVKIAFVASDNGNPDATGWAIDDVQIISSEIAVLYYSVTLDGTLIAVLSDTTFRYPFQPSLFTFGANHIICVEAQYATGHALTCKNIAGYRLNAPSNLYAMPNQNAIILTWIAPSGSDAPGAKTEDDNGMIRNSGAIGSSGELNSAAPGAGVNAPFDNPTTEIDIKYTSDNFNNAIGLSAGGTLMAAARFTPAELGTYYGNKTITRVRIYLGAACTLVKLKIWEGGTSPTLAGTEVYSADVTSQVVAGTWSTVALTGSGINLVAGKEYRIGYEITHAAGTNPLAYDAGCTAPGKSDLTYFNGSWSTLSSIGFTGDVMIKGVIDDALPVDLIGYILYRNGAKIAEVSKNYTMYWDQILEMGLFCYTITAVYDLTNYGFPGQRGESPKCGPNCAYLISYCDLPFTEDWTTGQFDVHEWSHDQNWVIDGILGNPPPTVKFKAQPKLTGYSSKLTTKILPGNLITTTTPYCIYLDFDYLLKDNSASGTEKLTIEVFNGDSWIPVKELINAGDKAWTREHINISNPARNTMFKVRFNANGANSELINYWLVDNVKVYANFAFPSPANLQADNTGNAQSNDVQLTWEIPELEYLVGLIVDDSTWEGSLAINPGYSGWLGNKFASNKGKLRSVDVQWQNNDENTSSPVHADIFDSDHKLIGSSPSFLPVADTWQTIPLPNVAIKGDFYAMIHFDKPHGFTPLLKMDTVGSSGRPNNGWFYDGVNWSQMNAFGFNECVFSIRAIVKHDVDCEGNPAVMSRSENGSGNRADPGGDNVKSTNTIDGLISYELYRRTCQSPVIGPDSLFSEWVKISTTTTTSYLDKNLDVRCYQYYVKAIYTEGFSIPSNVDETCFLVGLNELNGVEVALYPNPANTITRLEFAPGIKYFSVFNTSGRQLSEGQLTGQTTVFINTSGYSPGVYYVRFISLNDDFFVRKLVIVH